MSSIRLKAAAPASFAVTVAERWCYPAGISLPSNPDLPHLPCRHQPTRASKAASEPQTSASLVCSQHTVCNRGASPSVPPAHTSPMALLPAQAHTHLPLQQCPAWCCKEGIPSTGSLSSHSSSTVWYFQQNSHTHRGCAHCEVLSRGLTLLHVCMEQWVLPGPAAGTSPKGSAGVKSHLCSLERLRQCQVTWNRGRRGGKDTSHCQHWKLLS